MTPWVLSQDSTQSLTPSSPFAISRQLTKCFRVVLPLASKRQLPWSRAPSMASSPCTDGEPLRGHLFASGEGAALLSWSGATPSAVLAIE